ncbi:MAG: Gfo/Idh/MocA family oxidoreductase [Firmicutes bacterium]|nr:Gfo/Idh/MocA family oxidoreductase [Bacillota bacterium]
MKTIRWAVVGLGKISRRMTRVIQSVEGATVSACVSSSKERAIEYANKYGIEHALTYNELAENPSLVDAVYICTHMNMHAKPAMMYLSKKLPVMVEKTFATSIEDAKSIIDCAIENKTLVMEAMWTRLLPATQALHDVLANDNVGKIISIDSKFEVGIGHTKNSRVFKKEVGGGAMYDIGIYPTTYTHMLLGMPQEIEANAKFRDGVDTSVNTTFTYDNGAVAKFRISTEPFTLKEYYTIETEKATIKVPSFFDARKIIVSYKDGRKKRVIKCFNGIEFGRRGKPDGFTHEIIHFSQLIRDGKTESSILTHQMTLEVMELIMKQLKAIGL